MARRDRDQSPTRRGGTREARPIARRSGCPISRLLDLVGDRWSLLIVRDLLFGGECRYGDFLTSDEGISTNILADRLKRLEVAGIVTRGQDSGSSARHYRLTERGVDLMPVLLEMILWSARHDPGTTADPTFVRRLQRDREGLVRELRKALLGG